MMGFVYDDGLESDGVDLPQTLFPQKRLVCSHGPAVRVSQAMSLHNLEHVQICIPRRLVLRTLLDLHRPTREEPHNLFRRLARKLDAVDNDEGPRRLVIVLRRRQS